MVVPYLQKTTECIGEDKTALVIIDNFKGQTTQSVIQLVEDHNVHACMLPPNTTDLLQLMNISVNEPAAVEESMLAEEVWYNCVGEVS